MITVDETLEVRRIREMAENGKDSEVSFEERQWVLDIFRREGIPVPRAVYDGAKEGGFNIEGLKVEGDE